MVYKRAIDEAAQREGRIEGAIAMIQYSAVADAIDAEARLGEVRRFEREACDAFSAWAIPTAPIALQAHEALTASQAKPRHLTDQQSPSLKAGRATNAEVARRTGIRPERVKRHLAEARAKLGAGTTDAAVALVKRLGEA